MEDRKEAEKNRHYLNREFPDGLKEQLEKGYRMKVDPVELILVVGLLKSHEAKEMIGDLLDFWIISDVKKPVAWCTQMFFVPKP